MSGNMNGKRPLSKRAKGPTIYSADELFGNTLSIPPEVRKELDEAGLVGRWLDANILTANGGYHTKGWVPYKSKAISSVAGLKFGSDPEGILRRGTLILGVKTKEDVDKHKKFLRQQAQLQSATSKKKAYAEQLKQKASDPEVEILEGYEDENQNSQE